METLHRCRDGPCPISPHPDLLKKLAKERKSARAAPAGSGGQVPLSPGSKRLSRPTGTIPGLNDGTIFPKSFFANDVSTRPLAARMSSAALERAPLRGTIRVIVVLVDFDDQVMNANASQRMKDLFFSTGRTIRTGSATEYYQDVSGGKISLGGEVIGPFRMPRKLSEYGNGSSGLGSAPNASTLAGDAFAAARGKVNFAPYDNDRNGFVDAFIVVHAGTGAEVTNDPNGIWSCKWTLPAEQSVNGVKVFGFLTIPEDAEVGVCAHELGHLLFGWPDLYDIDNPDTIGVIGVISEGIGNWCLMAGGSWGRVGNDKQGTTPCHPSAWCKSNQGWTTIINETSHKFLSLPDVKTQREIHRLWTNGDTTSQEYFLIENRQPTGFDASLPGGGLLVWHIDDAVENNRDERHPKVGLLQADGLNQLATSTAGRGDDGDPFPGRSNNTLITEASNPNSKTYTGADSQVAITNISPSQPTMTMKITVSRSFDIVYSQGDPGSGIGGYDLRSRADRVFSFDGTSSGRRDHLVLYRPGTGTCWIMQNGSGAFSPIYARGDPGNGIGGYDLRSVDDRGLPFDFNSSGKADHLVFYRPGQGAIFIVSRQGNDYVAKYAQGGGGQGIGGYDLRSSRDRIFAFDYNHSGKLDHLCLYRPGTGTFWILRNDFRSGGSFTPVYAQGDPGSGIGGYDLRSTADRAFAFDWEGSGRQDYIALYRPGTGTFWCLKNDNGRFTPVFAQGDPGNGVGGYDLKSPNDRLFAFDWAGTGKQDHVVCYRPGTGTFWCLQNNRNDSFEPVFAEGDPGAGLNGYDLRSNDDRILAFDWSRNGKTDDLVLYRRNASGTIWIMNRR